MCISPVVDRLKEDEGEEGEGEQTSRRTRPEKQCRSNTTSACLDGKIIAKKEAKPCSHQTSQPHPNPPSQQGKGGQQRHSSTLGAGNIAKPWFVAPTPDWTDVRQGGGGWARLEEISWTVDTGEGHRKRGHGGVSRRRWRGEGSPWPGRLSGYFSVSPRDRER